MIVVKKKMLRNMKDFMRLHIFQELSSQQVSLITCVFYFIYGFSYLFSYSLILFTIPFEQNLSEIKLNFSDIIVLEKNVHINVTLIEILRLFDIGLNKDFFSPWNNITYVKPEDIDTISDDEELSMEY